MKNKNFINFIKHVAVIMIINMAFTIFFYYLGSNVDSLASFQYLPCGLILVYTIYRIISISNLKEIIFLQILSNFIIFFYGTITVCFYPNGLQVYLLIAITTNLILGAITIHKFYKMKKKEKGED